MEETSQNRRDLMRLIAGATAVASAAGVADAVAAQGRPINGGPWITRCRPTPLRPCPAPRPKIAMLIHPKMVLLDLVGALTVFNIAQCDVFLVWKDRNPVPFEVGIAFPPSATFDECPHDLDAIVVPGA